MAGNRRTSQAKTENKDLKDVENKAGNVEPKETPTETPVENIQEDNLDTSNTNDSNESNDNQPESEKVGNSEKPTEKPEESTNKEPKVNKEPEAENNSSNWKTTITLKENVMFREWLQKKWTKIEVTKEELEKIPSKWYK